MSEVLLPSSNFHVRACCLPFGCWLFVGGAVLGLAFWRLDLSTDFGPVEFFAPSIVGVALVGLSLRDHAMEG